MHPLITKLNEANKAHRLAWQELAHESFMVRLGGQELIDEKLREVRGIEDEITSKLYLLDELEAQR